MVSHHILGKVPKTCVDSFSQIHSITAYSGQGSKGENRGAGGSKREVIEQNGERMTLVLCFSNNNKNSQLRDSSALGSPEQPCTFLIPSFLRSLYQQKTDGL